MLRAMANVEGMKNTANISGTMRFAVLFSVRSEIHRVRCIAAIVAFTAMFRVEWYESVAAG